MRVFVAGATGVLGRRIVETCTDRGHEVVGLTRDERGDAIVHERGGTPHRGDVLEPSTLADGVTGADVVIHAATAIPTDTNPDESDWALNDRIRREGTENLLDAATSAAVDRFVFQSIVWLARRPDGEPFDESSDPNPDRSTQSALDAERLLEAAANKHDIERVILRGGFFYAPDAAHTRTFGEQLLARRLPSVGRGLLGRKDATLSFVHAGDAGRAFTAAAVGDATGTFHVVDDEPVAWGTFLEALADRLGAPSPRRVPAWLARWGVGDNLLRMLTSPMPTSNDRFRDAFDWTPNYPTYRKGLDQVVDTWRDEGTIEKTDGETEWVAD